MSVSNETNSLHGNGTGNLHRARARAAAHGHLAVGLGRAGYCVRGVDRMWKAAVKKYLRQRLKFLAALLRREKRKEKQNDSILENNTVRDWRIDIRPRRHRDRIT